MKINMPHLAVWATHLRHPSGDEIIILTRMLTGRTVCVHHVPKDGAERCMTPAEVAFMTRTDGS
jgi:hypothetical protein